jgi:hypothetical protein
MAAIAKIDGYQLRFENELSSAASATTIKRVAVSAGDAVNHRILGYYGRPTSSADILIDFQCAHPHSGPAKYQNGGGPPERQWNGELRVDGSVRRASAATKLRELVVTSPPAPVGAVIKCSFEVKKRWSRELSDWVPVAPGHFDTCDLAYRVEP